MAETGERKRDEKQIEAAGEEEPKVRLFLLLALFSGLSLSYDIRRVIRLFRMTLDM